MRVLTLGTTNWSNMENNLCPIACKWCSAGFFFLARFFLYHLPVLHTRLYELENQQTFELKDGGELLQYWLVILVFAFAFWWK